MDKELFIHYLHGKKKYQYFYISGIATIDGNRIAVYPNPTSGLVSVTGLEAHAEIELVDMTGRTLPLRASWHGNEATIDLGGLAPGLYLLSTSAGTAKLLKR
ncbi:MAG: T9SS type A sorting domain-containing protein [Bacteroidales bacterium]|nr:T9SS type A sorting domain-containing protein [Bacteroidales bacterium]